MVQGVAKGVATLLTKVCCRVVIWGLAEGYLYRLLSRSTWNQKGRAVHVGQEGMIGYFELLWQTPGLLSEHAVVGVDMTPFKADRASFFPNLIL